MRVWFDTEFHERGAAYPIDLISIGMVREDGAELYLINYDCDWRAVLANPWLRGNVVPALPTKKTRAGLTPDLMLDRADPRVHQRDAVAAQVKQFLSEAAPNLELWAWYADYDHVVLSQLFGRMIDLPEFMPMYTRDLKQEVDRLNESFSEKPLRFDEEALRAKYGITGAHDALADARYCRVMAEETRWHFYEWTNA